MKAKIIKIGNSRGVRLPRTVIEEVGLGDEVLLEASRGALVIRPVNSPRSNWSESFKRMALEGDDELIDFNSANKWDDKEWEWK
jgi:antitoxin MazE